MLLGTFNRSGSQYLAACLHIKFNSLSCDRHNVRLTHVRNAYTSLRIQTVLIKAFAFCTHHVAILKNLQAQTEGSVQKAVNLGPACLCCSKKDIVIIRL